MSTAAAAETWALWARGVAAHDLGRAGLRAPRHLARLRALARRGSTERTPVPRVGDLELDPATQRVRRGDVEVSLSTNELQLLEVFMRHPGELLSP